MDSTVFNKEQVIETFERSVQNAGNAKPSFDVVLMWIHLVLDHLCV